MSAQQSVENGYTYHDRIAAIAGGSAAVVIGLSVYDEIFPVPSLAQALEKPMQCAAHLATTETLSEKSLVPPAGCEDFQLNYLELRLVNPDGVDDAKTVGESKEVVAYREYILPPKSQFMSAHIDVIPKQIEIEQGAHTINKVGRIGLLTIAAAFLTVALRRWDESKRIKYADVSQPSL